MVSENYHSSAEPRLFAVLLTESGQAFCSQSPGCGGLEFIRSNVPGQSSLWVSAMQHCFVARSLQLIQSKRPAYPRYLDLWELCEFRITYSKVMWDFVYVVSYNMHVRDRFLANHEKPRYASSDSRRQRRWLPLRIRPGTKRHDLRITKTTVHVPSLKFRISG